MRRCRPRSASSRRCCAASMAPPTARKASTPFSKNVLRTSRVHDMPDLDHRVAIVTGAAMGIGRASALALARAGAAVLIADVEEEAGEQTKADIEAEGGRALFLRTDVRSFADAEAATATAIKAWGRVDIL